MKTIFVALWRYRQFIISSIKNDFRARFVRSRLGGMWVILHPLAQVAIFAFVLSKVMTTKLPGIENTNAYALYLLSGMAAWSVFQENVSRSVNIFIDNSNLLKKIVFPRIALPVIVSGSSLLNNVVLLTATIAIFFILGHSPGSEILWLPFLLIVNISFSTGLGLFLGILNVFIRDIGQIVPIILQFWFWLTPVVYMREILPEDYQVLIQLNPMYAIVTSYQDILVFGTQPNWKALIAIAVVAVALLLFSLLLFRRASPEMVDVL